MGYTVSRLARLAGVSVRTLHHYDQVGLLRPSGRSRAGYRLYGEGDLVRLQQVLFYRELEVPLERIREILDDPTFEPLAALASHRKLLMERATRLARLIETIDRTAARLRGEDGMLSDEELYEGFPKEKAERWQAEARARWGAAYDESTRRVRSWSRGELAAARAEGAQTAAEVAALMDRAPADPAVQAQVERLHGHLRRFYEPTPAMIAGLGELYVEHPEFCEHYEAIRPGLAAFLRAAMAVYGRALEARQRDADGRAG
jgi:DNA-binding transcriptional MerR regulator